MSKRLTFTLVLMALVLLGLSACTPCDMVAPTLLLPAEGELTDVPFPFVMEWNYTDTCPIDAFEIEISKDLNFIVGTYSTSVDGSDTTLSQWYPDYESEYFWRVRAADEGVSGPYSNVGTFFSGPICSSGDLVAPILTSPSFGDFFDSSLESLEWDWPLNNCSPESYLVEVSMGTSSFTDTTYNGATSTPKKVWGFVLPLPTVTQFWWRVSALVDGVTGPPSAEGMFWTGPACAASSLLTPHPDGPINNDVVTDLLPTFSWSYFDDTCVPEGYRVRVSKTADMSEIIFDANNPKIAAQELISQAALDDCGEYYWQVSAISQGIEGPASSVQRFVVDTAGACDCDPASLPIPELVSPNQYEVVPDLNPTLRWMNPEFCFPEVYVVSLNESHDFSGPDLGGGGNIPYSNSWGPGSPLESSTQYWWKAFSGVGTDFSEFSSPSTFFTGPACTSHAELTVPEVIYPASGAVIDTLVPALQFVPSAPACIPGGYLVHLHTLPDLSDPNLLGEYGVPNTVVVPEPPLLDCTTYYWNVTPVHHADYGPTSPTWTFTTNKYGSCFQPLEDACRANLGKDACTEAGGTYKPQTRIEPAKCNCP